MFSAVDKGSDIRVYLESFNFWRSLKGRSNLVSREEPRQVSMEGALGILVVMACRGLLAGALVRPFHRQSDVWEVTNGCLVRTQSWFMTLGTIIVCSHKKNNDLEVVWCTEVCFKQVCHLQVLIIMHCWQELQVDCVLPHLQGKWSAWF